MRILFLFIFSIAAFSMLRAQNDENFIVNKNQEISVDSLLALHKDYNANYNTILGYRIQIFKGSGNQALINAETLKTEFLEEFENTAAYISFMEPDYKIRVGDYRSKLDALNFLRKIKKNYPSAFVIQENIELIVLPKYQKTENYEQEDNSRY
jgi:hypothetical protein